MSTDKIRTSTQVYIDDPVDFHGERAINLGDPSGLQDAVPLKTLLVAIGKVPTTSLDLIYQYSIDGNSGWHTTYTNQDMYMQQSDDNGATWSQPIRIGLILNLGAIEISDAHSVTQPGFYSLVGGTKTNTPNNYQNDASMLAFLNPSYNAQYESIGLLYVDAFGKLWYCNNYDGNGFTPWKFLADSNDLNNKENVGVAANLIDNLKDSVPTAGNTLKKLYNLISGSAQEIQVATIAARDAYNIPSLPCNVFVQDDGDGKWALYKATTTGVGATFVKLSDPDLLNAVMSGSQIATAYESVSDVNRFTNDLKAKLDSITEIFTTALKSAYDGAVTWISTNGTNLVNHLSNSTAHITSGERTAWNAKEDKAKTGTYTSTTDTIEPDFASEIVITANTGTAAIALTTFNNLPAYQCERLLIVKNNRASALVITPRTADLIVGSTTYNFTNMDSATITIPAGKSAEISFLFTMTLTSNIEVRIKNSIQA